MDKQIESRLYDRLVDLTRNDGGRLMDHLEAATGAERQARLEARRKAEGLQRVPIWVRSDELAELRDRYPGPAAEWTGARLFGWPWVILRRSKPNASGLSAPWPEAAGGRRLSLTCCSYPYPKSSAFLLKIPARTDPEKRQRPAMPSPTEVLLDHLPEVRAAFAEAGGASGAWTLLASTCPALAAGMAYHSFQSVAPVILATVERLSAPPPAPEPPPKTFEGWTIQVNGKGYIRLFRKISAKLQWVYLGRTWSESYARKRIASQALKAQTHEEEHSDTPGETSAQRMRRLRERRAARLVEGLLNELPGLPDGALLDMLGAAYQEGFVVDFEAMAAELAQRLRAKRAGSQAVAATGQEADDGVQP